MIGLPSRHRSYDSQARRIPLPMVSWFLGAFRRSSNMWDAADYRSKTYRLVLMRYTARNLERATLIGEPLTGLPNEDPSRESMVPLAKSVPR